MVECNEFNLCSVVCRANPASDGSVCAGIHVNSTEFVFVLIFDDFCAECVQRAKLRRRHSKLSHIDIKIYKQARGWWCELAEPTVWVVKQLHAP